MIDSKIKSVPSELITSAIPSEIITSPQESRMIVVDNPMGTCLRIQVRFPAGHILKAQRNYLYDSVTNTFYGIDPYMGLSNSCGKDKQVALMELLKEFLNRVVA